MVWTIIWFILTVVYIFCAFKTYKDISNLPIMIGGFIGLFSSFIFSLYQNNLNFYFYIVKFKNWIKNYATKWQVNIRYDGDFDSDIIGKVQKFLDKKQKEHIPVKIFHKTLNSINFSIYDTLNFYFDFQPQKTSPYEYGIVDISLSAFEIGSNDAKDRINTILVPLLTDFQEMLHPTNCSYVVNIDFNKFNPFYSIYISHLKANQINSFTINLKLKEYAEKDIVIVQKDKIVINASNLHSLKELSTDFICLSANVKKYIKSQKNG